MKIFIELQKLSKGDKVAILSPSNGLPGLFPWVQDLGLTRIKESFGLMPVEYPTTRRMGSSLQDRAKDIMAAFSDPTIKGIIASIGGTDQIKLIKYLDPKVIKKNPKPFFGFSDNTHLHIFLWKLGIPSFYGGSVMTQFAMQGDMHEITIASIKHALFESGEFEMAVSDQYNDIGLNWADKELLSTARVMEKNEGLYWDGGNDATGILWGGCVESMIVQCTTAKYLPKDIDLEGTVLFLETSEGIPKPWIIRYLLTGFGERGWLNKFQAVLIGRPKAWEFDQQKTEAEKKDYKQEQRETVLKVVREYNNTIPIIQNVDFGHTDPQVILPMGSKVLIDSTKKKIFLKY